MNLREKRLEFEASKRIYDSALLTFHGVEGYDVYNCSIPFTWQGKRYIYGRVERRGEWARSRAMLFEETGKDDFTRVPESMLYQLEDPYIAFIKGEMVMGGTHVRFKKSEIDTYYGYFYHGTDLEDLYYFTTGPDYMKDIRLVQLKDGRIGVFSRPRHAGLEGGVGSQIGFTTIADLSELDAEVVENAPYLKGLFGEGEWGGPNQAYALSSGKVGVIGHMSYGDKTPSGQRLSVYMNSSFVIDPDTCEVLDFKIIGTRPCYPAAPAKRPDLIDCTFTSGIVMREDGKCELYGGCGDTHEGRLTIDYPFEGFGEIVEYGR